MTAIAVLSILLALGCWAIVRYADARHRVDHDLATYLLTVPTEWTDHK